MKKGTTSEYVVSGKSKKISKRSYQKSFEQMLGKLQINHRGFHTLHHIFARVALGSEMDIKTLPKILGHKNPTITLQRNVCFVPEHKRALMDRVGKKFTIY